MAGIYGNDPEDRYFEGLLLTYLDDSDDVNEFKLCEDCDTVLDIDETFCPKCWKEFED